MAGVVGAQRRGGDYARGLGYFNMGTGIYNLDTAQARSINADTFMRWNQYSYEAHLEATRRYVAKRDGDAAKNKATYNEIIKNLRDHPTARDVENGDALNAALEQLSDPRISSSSLKIATTPIDAQVDQGHSRSATPPRQSPSCSAR